MAGKAFFLMRLNDHVQYLKKISNTLEGKADFQACSHTECKLGQWIYGEGSAEIATLTNAQAQAVFESIKDPHEQFHTVSKEVLEKKRAGDEVGAQQAVTEMHKLSTIIYNNLLKLDGMS